MIQGPGTYINLEAAGNILPMSFVKLSTNTDFQCLQCTNGATPIGVAGTWTRYAGGTPANDDAATPNLEAVSGEFPLVAGPGTITPLICGNTSWAAGNYLTNDNLGYGTPCTSNGDIAGAIALEAATVGVHGRVLVIAPIKANATTPL